MWGLVDVKTSSRLRKVREPRSSSGIFEKQELQGRLRRAESFPYPTWHGSNRTIPRVAQRWAEKGCSEEGFPSGADSKESSCNAGDPGLIPGSGRSPGGGHGNSLRYSCLEDPRDRGAGRATVLRGHQESDWTESLTLRRLRPQRARTVSSKSVGTHAVSTDHLRLAPMQSLSNPRILVQWKSSTFK